MLCCEIIRTCSHEKVAEAAVLSIGPGFRDRLSLLASASGKSTGAYVAALVRRFGDEATESDLVALNNATAGSDMPVLDGLRFIVDYMIGGSRKRGPGERHVRGGSNNERPDRCAQAA